MGEFVIEWIIIGAVGLYVLGKRGRAMQAQAAAGNSLKVVPRTDWNPPGFDTVSNGGATPNQTPPPWGSVNDQAPASRPLSDAIVTGVVVVNPPPQIIPVVASGAPAGSGGQPITITNPLVPSYAGAAGPGTGGTRVDSPLISA
jgi:hypothetical protein